MAHAFNPSTREVEAGGSLGVRGQLGLQGLVSGQAPKLQRNLVSEKNNKIKLSTNAECSGSNPIYSKKNIDCMLRTQCNPTFLFTAVFNI